MTLSVAVIGSGIAGLSAAHASREAGFDVCIFEAQDDLGMAAHSRLIDGGIVDAPLRIMNPDAWPSTLALARRVGVNTFPINVYTSCSWSDRRTWFRSSRMPLTGWPLAGSWRYVDLRSARLALGMTRLARLTRRLEASNDQRLLAEVLAEHEPDALFWRGLILPILQTICTCDEQHVLAWPATQLLSLLHGILHTSEAQRMRGGTAALAAALARDIPRHVGSRVTEVRQQRESVTVRNARGEGGRFDRVIVATQANQLGFLDQPDYAEERRVLQGIEYASGELVVHRDERFMPRHQRDWTALNFLMDRGMRQATFSVWMNAVEPTLTDTPALFQTWNPQFEPAAEKTLARLPMQRAVVTRRTAGVLEQLRNWHAQPGRRLFYCGSWAHEGVPLLESAVRSAQTVVERLGSRRSN